MSFLFRSTIKLVNPIALAAKGLYPIWSKGSKIVAPRNPVNSMNAPSDIVNGDIKNLMDKPKGEAYNRLSEVVCAISKPEKITVYAATTLLYHGTQQKKLSNNLLTETLIPCLEQKLEYMDLRGLEQALWSCKNNPELKDSPLIIKLEEEKAKRIPEDKIVKLKNSLLSPNQYKELGDEVSNLK